MNEVKKVLKFEKLVYEVKNKDKDIKTKYARIIDGLSGTIESGKLTAVMGSSGCGKTHFFELLIGNLSSNCKTSGQIFYNNEEREWETWTKKIAFLPQDDIYYPELTPYETIMYNLSFDTSLSYKQKCEMAKQALEASSIYNKRDAPIKTLSGGERKRAMVAITMVNNPEILILDEPTTGLDSNSSLKIVSSLKEYAEKNNKIVIMTVHQPGEGLFNLFGDLIFLTRGGTFYQGPVQKIPDFLKENNIEIQEKVSLAEFLFLLHSDEHYSVFDTSKYRQIIQNIETRNAVSNLTEPESCNNNKVFLTSLNIKHSYLLLKHNLNLLFKSPTPIRNFLYFFIFTSSFYFSSCVGFINVTLNQFEEIDFASAVPDLTFSQKLITAYSLFTNYFCSQIVFYTALFSLNMQAKDIFELEIFTGKYSILSHYVYNYIQKYLVSIFFITIDFLILLYKNRECVIPMNIVGLTYLMTMMFLGLTLLTNSMITALPIGSKMETFLLFSNNLMVYYVHPVFWFFYTQLAENMAKPLRHLINTALFFPNVCYDLMYNVLARKEYLAIRNSESKFFKALSFLKFDESFSELFLEPSEIIKNYDTNSEWVLDFFTIGLTYNKLKIVAALAIVNSVIISLGLIWIFKVPNIRTKLQK